MSVHVGETIKHEIHINVPRENLIWGTIALARSKLVFFLIFMRLPLLLPLLPYLPFTRDVVYVKIMLAPISTG